MTGQNGTPKLAENNQVFVDIEDSFRDSVWTRPAAEIALLL